MLGVLLVCKQALSAQLVERSDSVPVQVNVSAAETNRLAVEGRKIARVVPAQAGALLVERDDMLGVLYFRSTGGATAMGTITVFVTDDQGYSYRLVLVPRPISGEDIVIRPAALLGASRSGSSGSARAPSYQRKIKNLLLTLRASDPSTVQTLSAFEVLLWQEARLILTARVIEDDVVGETYRLTNVADVGMLLEEQELYKTGVLAVAALHHTLGPGESTQVYIVRERQHHD